MEGEVRGLRGEIKCTQAKGENRRLRGEIKGADNAKEQHKYIREDDGEKYKVRLVLRGYSNA